MADKANEKVGRMIKIEEPRQLQTKSLWGDSWLGQKRRARRGQARRGQAREGAIPYTSY